MHVEESLLVDRSIVVRAQREERPFRYLIEQCVLVNVVCAQVRSLLNVDWHQRVIVAVGPPFPRQHDRSPHRQHRRFGRCVSSNIRRSDCELWLDEEEGNRSKGDEKTVPTEFIHQIGDLIGILHRHIRARFSRNH